MTIADESAAGAIFRDPPPEGFSRRVLRLAPGRELAVPSGRLPDAIIVVEQGVLELGCRSGTSRRFGPGTMIPLARLSVSRLRSVGPGTLVLVAVSRASLRGTDEFLRDPGSYCDD